MTAYSWRVQVSSANSACPTSDWSDNATFVSGAWASLTAFPIWHANSSAKFVFLRANSTLASTAGIVSAYAVATANPYYSSNGEMENAKLLGAYRLYVNGAWIGIGPGRPGRCGPLCPIQNDPLPCSCTPEHVYDMYDVTAAVESGGGAVVLAVQAYNIRAGTPASGYDSKVMVQVLITFDDGSQQVIGTDSSWAAWNGDAYQNATCCTAQQWFEAYSENYAAALEPVNWRESGFNDSAWPRAEVASPWSVPLTARPTLPLAITTFSPTVIAYSLSHYFIDTGREIQGGLQIAFDGAVAGQALELRLGEETFTGGGCDFNSSSVRNVMYHMRTGNVYQHTWTLRDGSQVLDMHEYMEFRYAEIVPAGGGSGAQCVNSAVGDYTTPLTLACPSGGVITNVTFASYGTPTGCCSAAGGGANTFIVNASCHWANSSAMLAAICVGQSSCTLDLATLFAGKDPCHLVNKWLDASVSCSGGVAAAPFPPPNVTAWQLTYPAAYIPQQFTSSDADMNDIWDLCQYTVVAGGGLDMYVDSNTRQRSVICAEAMSINILMQYATSAEWAQQVYTLEYMLNSRPSDFGWAEWQALSIMSVYNVWMHSGDLSLFARMYDHLRNFTEVSLIDASTGLWTCVNDDFDCNNPEIDWPSGMRDGFVFKPADTVVNVYTYNAMQLFARMAAALGGHDADVAFFTNASSALRSVINSQLYNASCGCYYDGVGTTHSAWHSSVYALAFGVPTADATQAVFDFIYSRSAGDAALCTPGNVFPQQSALDGMYSVDTDHGWAAYELITCDGVNSWKAMLAQGATMTMEAWNPDEKPNLTWSHSWAASPADIILVASSACSQRHPALQASSSSHSLARSRLLVSSSPPFAAPSVSTLPKRSSAKQPRRFSSV